MKKKNVIKKIQSERPTAFGRLMNAISIAKTRKHEIAKSEEDTEETQDTQEIDVSVTNKRNRKPKKTQEIEIIEQIPEENVQQQEQTGENQ